MYLLRTVVASSLLCPLLIYAAEFQYATFGETEVLGKNREVTIILSFSTDPGLPITVAESSKDPISARQAAYASFFKRMNWNGTPELDPLYVLNRLGKLGWEVIHVRKERGTAFVTKDPSVEESFFLKLSK
jgi:hypothetical protein